MEIVIHLRFLFKKMKVIMSQKKEMLYEGKAKQVFATDKPDEVVVRYKDDATAFNAQKRGQFDRKGELNNAISTLIFGYLIENGIPTHFIEKLDDREQLVKKWTSFH
jgi:phosphoribosylaminoimidazole-succinocarboxamide synthase